MKLQPKKPASHCSAVALAFAAALAAVPAVAPAAAPLTSAVAPDTSAQIVPSAAALARMNQFTQTMLRPGPRWIELWPEVIHVEAVRR